MKRYVIIGNGVAAAGCIEGIRSVEQQSEITVISKERHPVYCRPLISYYLEGKTDLDHIGYRKPSFYADNGCKVLYERSAEKIEPDARQVVLSSGERIPYDNLCICTGSSPFVPKMAGLEKVKKQFAFMTLDDTLALEKAIEPDSKVLIVGAGLIGLKCAEGLHGRVGSIAVCDLAPRVLSSILDDFCAERMRANLENHGITFYLGDSVAEFEPKKAHMQSGKTVDFDVLVLAVGVRPCTALFTEAGGKINRGIPVNEKGETTLPHIYAAGDCTEAFDISAQAVKIMALLPNAYMQGRTAGVNLAGGQADFSNAIPMNSIGFFGLHCMTAGTQFKEEDGGSVYEEVDDNHIKRLFVKDDRLTGFMLIGDVRRAGIYTALVRNQTPLSGIDFERMKVEPQLSAMGEAYRGRVLKGVV